MHFNLKSASLASKFHFNSISVSHSEMQYGNIYAYTYSISNGGYKVMCLDTSQCSVYVN